MAVVLGVDGDKRGWVGIVLIDGGFASAHLLASLDEVLEITPAPAAVAIDMPIGWCEGLRVADTLLRARLPGKSSSVFNSPPAAVREAISHEDASARATAATGKGISRQSWALIPKIEEATAFSRTSGLLVVEAHPELSFASMGEEGPVLASKSTWSGHRERLRRLAQVGIDLPDDLGLAGAAGVVDVLDAAAVAWSANRVADGTAFSLSAPLEIDEDGTQVAVWC
jgi:predicted RNase H-like nuclease